jgi:hypothetical protein
LDVQRYPVNPYKSYPKSHVPVMFHVNPYKSIDIHINPYKSTNHVPVMCDSPLGQRVFRKEVYPGLQDLPSLEKKRLRMAILSLVDVNDQLNSGCNYRCNYSGC